MCVAAPECSRSSGLISNGRFPGGESFQEQAARVQAAMADIRAAERPALVVCHRHTMRFALSGWSGEARPRLGGDWRAIGNGEIVALT